jgi:phage terminase large subunit GpA-like protein
MTLLSPQIRNLTKEKLDKLWRTSLIPPKDIAVDVWAEKHLKITPHEGSVTGSLHLDRSNYMREILATLKDPAVRVVTLCFAAQTGKTLILLISAVYTVAEDPGPILFALSIDQTARYTSENRIDPLVDASELLRSLKLQDRHDWTKAKKRFATCVLSLIGGQSQRSAKSRPIKLLICDEIDDYKPASDKQAGTLAQIRERVNGWVGSKTFLSSTPTTETGNVWVSFLAGSQEFYHIPCPHCGLYQKLIFSEDTLRWDEGARLPDGKWDAELVEKTAHYICQGCGQRIEDKHKPEMILRGKWIPEAPHISSHRSFHLNSLYANWLTFGATARRFIESKDYPDALKEFRTHWLAEPWGIRTRAANQNKIANCCGTYEPGTIPEPPVAVVLTVDVQAERIWFVVRAWSGENSYLVEYGSGRDLDEVRYISQRAYAGNRISHVVIDSGWQAGTTRIYDFCIANNFIPSKGYQTLRQPFQWGKTSLGTSLLVLNTSILKDTLADKIEAEPRHWHIYKESPALREYFVQMASEQIEIKVNKQGFPFREWRKIHENNHLFDCEVMSVGVSEALGFKYVAPPSAQPQPKPKEESKHQGRFLLPDGTEAYKQQNGSFSRPDGRGYFDLR